MSSRAYKKLVLKNKSQAEAGGSDDDDDTVVVKGRASPLNAFDLLGEDADDVPDTDDANDDDEAASTAASAKAAAVTQQKKTAGKPKGKKGKRQGSGKQDAPGADGDEEDIDALVQKLGITYASSTPKSSSSAGEEDALLAVNPKHLNSDAELIKLFGRHTINQVRKESAFGARRVKSRAALVKPKDNWPRVSTGVSMEFVETRHGVNWFRMRWSDAYRRAQDHFFFCVNTHDPNSFQALLQEHPYHVDSLLQLAEVCKQTGEGEMALDLTERAIYCFESSWHHMFNVTSGTCRLDYSLEENKPFFVALFRYIQLLGRESSPRTAFEYCKMLLSLDLSDPLYVLFVFDYFALRAQSYEFLLRFARSREWQDKVSTLPNFAYSTALAAFFLQGNKKSSSSSSSSSSAQSSSSSSSSSPSAAAAAKPSQTMPSPPTDVSADALLQSAMLLFPGVVPELSDKAKIGLDVTVGGTSTNLALHSFIAGAEQYPSLTHLTTLFVQRNHALWKEPAVGKWFRDNLLAVTKRVDRGDAEAERARQRRAERYGGNALNIYNHLILSEYTGETAGALPPDLVQLLRHGGGGPQLYEAYHNRPQQDHSDMDPFMSFISSLLVPFDPSQPTPPAMQNLAGAASQLYDTFAGMFTPAPRDPNAPPEDDDDDWSDDE